MHVTESFANSLLAAGKINWTDSLRTLYEPWTLFGFFAQSFFALRFVVQWLASERRGRSYVPTIFWYISLVGTGLLTMYAIHRRDPVFILGQTLNSLIYVRNLMLIYRPRVEPRTAAAGLPVVAPDRAESKSRIMQRPKEQ